jgi:hypothetical protein
MGDPAKKFVPRAPRYILGPGDNQVIRFAFLETKGATAALRTSMVNLSETGLAFLVDPVLAPELGETIKIEIPVPGGGNIAWFGQVVRIEMFQSRKWWFANSDRPTQERIMVGVRFEELPHGHQKSIRQGLEKSFLEALRTERHRKVQYWKHYLVMNGPKILLFALLFAAVIGVVVAMDRFNIRTSDLPPPK